MKIYVSLLLLCVALDGSVADPQREQPTETPGKLEIAKHPLVLERPVSPQNRKLDAGKLSVEVSDLVEQAQSLSSDVDQVAQGKLPKDLANKLKRIEKTSKHLRAELIP